MQDDHIPAPLAHRPNVEQHNQTETRVSLQEQDNPDGWIIATDPSGYVEVER